MESHKLLADNNKKLKVPLSLIETLRKRLSDLSEFQKDRHEFIQRQTENWKKNDNNLLRNYSRITWDRTTVERTVGPWKSRKFSKEYYPRLDIICRICRGTPLSHYTLNKSWEKDDDFQLVDIPEENALEIDMALKGEYLEDDFRKGIISDLDSEFTQAITSKYFQKFETADKDEKKVIAKEYFLHFNNNWEHLRRVIANKIHVPPNDLFKVKNEENESELPVRTLINYAEIYKPVLLKVLSFGGAGKSTLMWHFIHDLCSHYPCFYLQRANPKAIRLSLKLEPIANQKDISIFFLDNAITYDENKEQLCMLAEAIANQSASKKIVLIICERFYRYDKFKEKAEFEKRFHNTTYSIPYSNDSIREKVFDKVWNTLELDTDGQDTFRKTCFRYFIKNNFDSLVDSTINLLLSVNKEFKSIPPHEFDWDDWVRHCTNEYSYLQSLYKAVAFFYQFGTTVPQEFIKYYYKDRKNVEDALIDMLGSFGNTYAPIIRVRTEKGYVLTLRHEKPGEWFFKLINDGQNEGEIFFNSFLNNVKSKSYSYLFRNISRNNPDFFKSPYKNQLSNRKILNVIDGYLKIIPSKKYDREEFKLLMDRHFILFNMGRQKEAITSLEKIINLDDDINIYAQTRLASCLKVDDPDEAERLLISVIAIPEHANNSYANLELLDLYYIHNNENFALKQTEIFELAKSEISFARKFLTYISENFERLQKSTLANLRNLSYVKQELSISIAKLLVTKKASVAIDFLKDIVTDFSGTDRQKRTITELLIKLIETQPRFSFEAAMAVSDLNNLNEPIAPTDFYLYFVKARLICLEDNADFKKAENLFEWALNGDQNKTYITSTLKFYREYSRHLHDKSSKNITKSINILVKGVELIKKQYPLAIPDKVKLEICYCYNEILKLMQYGIRHPDGFETQYSENVVAFETESKSILEEIITKQFKKLPDSNVDQFNNFPVYEETVKLLAKSISLLSTLIVQKFLHVKWSGEDLDMKDSESIVKVIDLVEKALLYDEGNPSLLSKLVQCKLFLGQTVGPIIDKIDFTRFTTEQKASLAHQLFKENEVIYGKKTINRFGLLLSNDLRVKNDLAYCYLEANSWGYAIIVLNMINNPSNQTFKLIKKVAIDLPVTTYERAETKISFANRYLAGKNDDDQLIIKVINKTLYVKGPLHDCYTHYLENRTNIDSLERELLQPRAAFNEITKRYRTTLVHFLEKIVSKAKVLATKIKIYGKALHLIVTASNRLMGLKIDYSIISYNTDDSNKMYEKIRNIMMYIISVFFHIIDEKISISYTAETDLTNIIKKNSNPLFHKIFLAKLAESKSVYLINELKEALDYLETTFAMDEDIIGLLGRCYLLKKDFKMSKELLSKCLTFSLSDSQLSLLQIDLADWATTYIEDWGLKSFGDTKAVKHEINEAYRYLNNAYDLNKNTKASYDILTSRLNALIFKYR